MTITGLGERISEIRTGQVVLFFPTCGSPSADGGWTVPIHAWLHEPARNSRLRRATLGLLRRYVRYRTRLEINPLFSDRTRAFFVGGQGGRWISVRVGDQVTPIGKSGIDGHVRGVLHIPPQSAPCAGGWLDYTAHTDDATRQFSGRAHLLPETGLSIVSDIDDTIKHSVVRNRAELLANTFLREFQPVPDVARLYRDWSAAGAAFHYVSSSPWPLFEPLTEFLDRERFPAGTLHLRHIRLRDARLLKLFTGQPVAKLKTIEGLLSNHPRRRYVLIGDSGERDPEIYARVARRFGPQVVRILIRRVREPAHDAARLKKTFQRLPDHLWRAYDHADELAEEQPLWMAARE